MHVGIWNSEYKMCYVRQAVLCGTNSVKQQVLIIAQRIHIVKRMEKM